MRLFTRFMLSLSFMLAMSSVLYGLIDGKEHPPQGPKVLIAGNARALIGLASEPESPIRILLLGTSITARGDWPEGLQTALSECSTHPLRISRLARAGGSSDWGVTALKAHLTNPAMPRPDIVVIEFTVNDASVWHGLPLSISRKRTLELIAAIRAEQSVPFLATMNPAWGRNALERLGQSRYQAVYRDLALETGSGLIDSIPDWQALSEAERRLMLPDGLHPTAAGMEKIVIPAFFEALSPLICPRVD